MLSKKINYSQKNSINKPRVMMVARFLRGDEGITSHIATLAQELQKNGWEVALACGIDETESDNNRGIEWLESQGIQHYQIPFASFKLSPQNFIKSLKAISMFKSAIAQFKPDILHAHSLSVCPYINLLKSIEQFPFVSTCHMNPYVKRNSLEVKLSSWVNKYFNSHFLGDRIIAVSKEIIESYQLIMHVKENDIKPIYYGIDSEYFRPASYQERLKAKSQLGLLPDEKVVCLIGRLSRIKGHHILFEALAQLRSQGINITALCAGTGDSKQDICDYAAELGISDSVKMLGFVDSRQVLWASDAIVLPSKREALPLVICEAMLSGVVPIRTPASGAYDQIKDEVDGFIIDFGDSATLALRLKQIFMDSNLRATMSQAAINTANHKFTVESMGASTISLYNEAISIYR